MNATKPVRLAHVPCNIVDFEVLYDMGIASVGARLPLPDRNANVDISLLAPDSMEWIDGESRGCDLVLLDDRGFVRIKVYAHDNAHGHEPETIVLDVGVEVAGSLAAIETADLESVRWNLLSNEEKLSARAELQRLLETYNGRSRIVYFDQIHPIEYWLEHIARIEDN